MRKLLFLLMLCIFVFGFTTSTLPGKKHVLVPVVQTTMRGYLGDKINLCIHERIKKQDFEQLIEPFKTRNETRLWQTEFWGKWMLSAVAAYEYNHDPELLVIIHNAVSGLLATQTSDGYIGNYAPAAQLNHWDVWGCKYTLLGLLAYYDISNDPKALTAAQKLGDFLLNLIGPGKSDIVKTGNYRGMPSSSILEPMVLLYNRTSKKEYLDFAKYIVSQWETPVGPKLISKGMEGVPVAERFPNPPSWWSWENGQKAYEMMSCYDGLLELYKITAEPVYLQVVEKVAAEIMQSEINIAGSGTAFECFYHGAQRQTDPAYHTMETCVTFTWMKLCNQLLVITHNSLYADQIEKTAYNALLASMKYDGSQIAKYSPLEGRRQAGEEQCNMHINCCNANGPRAFVLLPKAAISASDSEIYINLYNPSTSQVTLNSKNKVTITQSTTYPVSGSVEIAVNPEKAQVFTIALRIPLWSENTTVKLNGSDVNDIKPGTFLKINRKWQANDKLVITLDMRGRLVELNGYQAMLRGPIVLARDSRFLDGYVDETAVIQQQQNRVDLKPSATKDANMWMAFTAPLILGTDLEGEFGKPAEIHFCDFASAGNTWDTHSRYKVWIRKTLNVMNTGYMRY